MSSKKSSLEKATGAGRGAILVMIVMVEAATRAMMNSVRTSKSVLTRQLYICSSERLSKVTVTVIQKTIRRIFPASTRRSSSALNWRPSCPTPRGI